MQDLTLVRYCTKKLLEASQELSSVVVCPFPKPLYEACTLYGDVEGYSPMDKLQYYCMCD